LGGSIQLVVHASHDLKQYYRTDTSGIIHLILNYNEITHRGENLITRIHYVRKTFGTKTKRKSDISFYWNSSKFPRLKITDYLSSFDGSDFYKDSLEWIRTLYVLYLQF